MATFVVSDLSARTRYRYAVSASGAPIEGTFRTFAAGPFSFRVVFASCSTTGSASPVFDFMRYERPDLFVHMGDLHYRNIGRNDPALFAMALRPRPELADLSASGVESHIANRPSICPSEPEPTRHQIRCVIALRGFKSRRLHHLSSSIEESGSLAGASRIRLVRSEGVPQDIDDWSPAPAEAT